MARHRPYESAPLTGRLWHHGLLLLIGLIHGCAGAGQDRRETDGLMPGRDLRKDPMAPTGMGPARTHPMEVLPPQGPPVKLRTRQEARFDELTLSLDEYLKVLEDRDFRLRAPLLHLSRERSYFTADLDGPAHRLLRERKEARILWVHVPLGPESLSRKGLVTRLAGGEIPGRGVLAADRRELLAARKIRREDYLGLLGKGTSVLFALFDVPENKEDLRLFALLAPGDGGGKLEWVRCPLLASDAPGTEGFRALSAGLELGRFEVGDWLRPEDEDAVFMCLRWLARHQAVDGSWKVTGHVDRCVQPRHCRDSSGSPGMEAGITALCVLAFLGAGYSPASLERYDGIIFGNTVGSGLHRLMELQGSSGWIGAGPDSDRGALNHALATLALVEAYGLTRDKIHEKCASKGVRALGAGQNRDGGWGDVPGRSDGFSTGVTLIVLRAARFFGLDADRTVEAKGLAYFEGLKNRASGRVGYATPGVDGASLEGVNEDRPRYPSLSAFPVIIPGNRPAGEEGLRALEEYPEAPLSWLEKQQEADYLFLFLSTWARFRVDGPSGPVWKRWSRDLREVLVKAQALKSEANVCEAGSWSPTDKWSSVGGRVYVTAINALTLEIYYRFDKALGVR